RWVWRVVFGDVIQKTWHEVVTEYVDATTGSQVSDQSIQNSQWPYRSRAPRAGIQSAKLAKIDVPLYDAAQRELRKLGRTDVRFDSFVVGEGIRLHQTAGYDPRVIPPNRMDLNAKGRLLSFDAAGTAGYPSPGAILARGRAIILDEHPAMPEGKFLIDGSITGRGSDVVYRETALGYEYLGSRIADVGFDAKGKIVRFTAIRRPLPRPLGLPKRILSHSQVGALALAAATSYVGRSTPTVRCYATAKVGALGWTLRGVGTPRLCYIVDVNLIQRTGMGGRGGGGSYRFDAETGRCLDRFPR
ncbi:MAG TPA: hypothetical protein VMI31_04385, partial [Fimbriimonadaceae bacterium]|nr:hypothetical protein [Fimbriimonadaceae bacterium]